MTGCGVRAVSSSGIADAKESSMPDFSKVQPAFSIATANDVAYHDMLATHNIAKRCHSGQVFAAHGRMMPGR